MTVYGVNRRGSDPLKGHGIHNWLGDIIVYTRGMEGHLNLVDRVLDRLGQAELSVTLAKPLGCSLRQRFVGMVVDRLGVRPSPSKRSAVSRLMKPITVKPLRALLDARGYLRKFVPVYSAMVALISHFLREKRLVSRKARKVKVPWGVEQDIWRWFSIHSPPRLSSFCPAGKPYFYYIPMLASWRAAPH